MSLTFAKIVAWNGHAVTLPWRGVVREWVSVVYRERKKLAALKIALSVYVILKKNCFAAMLPFRSLNHTGNLRAWTQRVAVVRNHALRPLLHPGSCYNPEDLRIKLICRHRVA